MNNKERNTM